MSHLHSTLPPTRSHPPLPAVDGGHGDGGVTPLGCPPTKLHGCPGIGAAFIPPAPLTERGDWSPYGVSVSVGDSSQATGVPTPTYFRSCQRMTPAEALAACGACTGVALPLAWDGALITVPAQPPTWRLECSVEGPPPPHRQHRAAAALAAANLFLEEM